MKQTFILHRRRSKFKPTLRSLRNHEKRLNCQICQNEINPTERLHRTNAGNIYHKKCWESG